MKGLNFTVRYETGAFWRRLSQCGILHMRDKVDIHLSLRTRE